MKYNLKCKDAKGRPYSVPVPSVEEGIRIAVDGFKAVSYTIRDRITREIVHNYKEHKP